MEILGPKRGSCHRVCAINKGINVMTIMPFAKKALLAAIFAGISMSASAVTHTLGAASPGLPLSFNSGAVPIGPFNDIFTFSLPANSGSGYSVINFPVPGFFNTLLATASLVSNPDGVLFNGDDSALTTVVSTANQIAFTWGAAASGNYYLNVAGITNGEFGGLYNGAITVTAVPEPESYAMLLAGLGVMGAIAVRRNKRNQG